MFAIFVAFVNSETDDLAVLCHCTVEGWPIGEQKGYPFRGFLQTHTEHADPEQSFNKMFLNSARKKAKEVLKKTFVLYNNGVEVGQV